MIVGCFSPWFNHSSASSYSDEHQLTRVTRLLDFWVVNGVSALRFYAFARSIDGGFWDPVIDGGG